MPFLATALEQATQLANLIQTNQINATGDQIFIRVQNEQAEWNTIKVSMNLFWNKFLICKLHIIMN